MCRLALTLILLAYALLATLYAIYTPKWQAPDEPAHFNYIRAIAETGALPVLQQGDYDQTYLEQIKAAKFPPTMPTDAIRYESYQPPLYYLAATPVYLATRGAGLDATVIALRLFSVALGVIVLLVAFNIVREVFPGEDLLALATVGLMAAIPQHIAVGASISNDLAAELVVALILWLAIKRVQARISNLQFSILGGLLFGVALLTKTTAYAPGAVLLIGAEVARTWGSRGAGAQGSASRITHHPSPEFTLRDEGLKTGLSRSPLSALRPTLYAFALALLIASPMFVRGALTYGVTDPLGIARHDAVVIGQPTAAEMIARYGLPRSVFDFFAVTFKSFWAQFGWMGVLVNDRIYVMLFALTGIAVFGHALRGLKMLTRRDALTGTQWRCVGLIDLLMLVAFADYIGYNFKFLQFQGRYLFPALISIALFLVVGLREIVAREHERVVLALLYAALLALDLACLFLFIVPQLRIAN